MPFPSDGGTTRAVNHSCSLKYLFWGHFPPEKPELAEHFILIEEVNIKGTVSAFPGHSFSAKTVAPAIPGTPCLGSLPPVLRTKVAGFPAYVRFTAWTGYIMGISAST